MLASIRRIAVVTTITQDVWIRDRSLLENILNVTGYADEPYESLRFWVISDMQRLLKEGGDIKDAPIGFVSGRCRRSISR